MGKRFDSYRRILELTGIAADMRLDANETAAFARQLEEIDTDIYRQAFPELKGTQLVPVKGNINPGAEQYTYRSVVDAGDAKPIANYADDLPRVDLSGLEESSRIYSFGASYAYSIQDLRRASMMRMAIDNERARIARERIAQRLDETIWVGNTQLGITGFANNAGVALVTPVTGTWSTATADQILADLLKLERTIIDDSKGTEQADTLVLPTAAYAIAATKPLGTDANKTVLEFFTRRALGIRNVEFTPRLNLANAAGNGPRAIAYKRDRTRLEAIVPVEFEQFPPEARNLAWNVNCHMRCGGVVIRYPGSLRYMDGI